MNDRDAAARAAYEEDVRQMPTYNNRQTRKSWEQLDEIARESWRRNPTAREWSVAPQGKRTNDC